MKKAKLVLLLGLVPVLYLVSCTHKHEHTTTLTKGETTHWYECECGDKKDEAAHEYSIAGEVTKAATCTEVGKQIYSCECGATTEKELAKLSHTHATTLTKGETTHWYACECGDKKDEAAHEYSIAGEVTKAATCTEAGKQTYSCACGATTEKELAKLSHTHATTLTKGETTHWYACECGDKKDEAAHEYSIAGEVTKAATCTEAGKQTYSCACGATTEKELAKLSHTHATTLTKGETTHWYACECGDKKDEAAHEYSIAGEVTKAATCTEAGKQTYSCECGATTEKELAKLAHAHATTLTKGETTHWYACECGDKKDEVAHEYSIAGEVTKAATCTEAGKQTYSCACGATTEKELAKLEHTYATTLTKGETTHWYACECGDKKDEAAHEYSIAGEVTKAATCTEAGKQTYSCACGATTEKELAKLEHTYATTLTKGETTHWYACECGDKKDEAAHEYTSNTVAPTCLSEGYVEFKCECGHSYIEEGSQTPKLKHVDENEDILCDLCNKQKVAPVTGSSLSLTHAINLVKANISIFDYKYYLEGTITEVKDAINGGIYITDGKETFFIRITKNEDGTIGYKNLPERFVVGDKIRIYGKLEKSTSSPYNPQMAEGWATLLEQHEHEYGEATCTEKAECHCGATTGEPKGHLDENNDTICDVCNFNTTLSIENIAIRTDNSSGVVDTTAGTYTWGGTEFDIVVSKGTSSQLYTTAKDHMRLYKGNKIEVVNKGDKTISGIKITVTNATQLTNIVKLLSGYTFTKDEVEFSVTIEYNSLENFVLTNTGSTLQIKSFEMYYK